MAEAEVRRFDSIVAQADSLGNGAVSDSLTEPFLMHDSLYSSNYTDSLSGMADSVVASDLFGPYSTLAHSVELVADVVRPIGFISGNILFEVLLLLCFISYTLILYHFKGETTSLMSIFRGDVYIGKLLHDQNFVFEFFLRTVIGLGMLVYALLLVKFTDMYWSSLVERILALSEWMGMWGSVAISLGLWLVICLIWILQTLVLKLAALLTPASEFIGNLVAIRRFFFALATLITTPLALIFALSSGISSQVMAVLIVVLVVLITIFIFSRTYKLFIGDKISISYWILYLCGVEVFPLSFLVFLALRNT